jgi:secreted Zn-dependent insulinase-like peptidase
MGHEGHSQSEEFGRPQCDKLLYGSIQLDNGLQAVLISDEKADKASAALDVSYDMENISETR